MIGRKGSKQIDGDARAIFAANLSELMSARMSGANKTQDLAAAVGISKSTVQRLQKGLQGVSIDLLARIARHLKVPAWRLLVPVESAQYIVDTRQIASLIDGRNIIEQTARPQQPGDDASHTDGAAKQRSRSHGS